MTERSMITKACWWMTLIDDAVLRQQVINSRRRAIATIPHLLCELHLRLKAVGLVSDPAPVAIPTCALATTDPPRFHTLVLRVEAKPAVLVGQKAGQVRS